MMDETLPNEKDKITLRQAIGERMRQIRKHLGLKQGELSQRFNFGRANLARIEKGEVFPNIPTLAFLYTQFSLSLPWIILGEGDMYRAKETGANAPTDPEIIALNDLMEKVSPFKHRMLSEYYHYRYTENTVVKHYFDLWKQTDHDAVSVPVSTASSTSHAGSVFYF